MGFQVADHDVAPRFCLGVCFLQHAVGLAHPRGHPEEDLVMAADRRELGCGVRELADTLWIRWSEFGHCRARGWLPRPRPRARQERWVRTSGRSRPSRGAWPWRRRTALSRRRLGVAPRACGEAAPRRGSPRAAPERPKRWRPAA